MSNNTPGAYKHLCGSDKLKTKQKEIAKLAQQSSQFLKKFKGKVLFHSKIIHACLI